MRGTRYLAGSIGLALMLALAGCGQADPEATLEVTSVPAAEIYVDGTSHGMSPATIELSAGEHAVELRLAKFDSFQTKVLVAANQVARIDAALTPQDPSDPDVIAVLAEANGIDVAPFVAPELTRGRAGKRAAAVLLWPRRDVRLQGLVSFGIEADESYGGDAVLQFRKGRKVLYREPFNPESVTTVRALPAAVVEAAKVNQKLTWGLYFEDRRRPITAEFRVVKRNKADRQLAKLDASRHVARQPEITQQILRATVLENNRLYSEALVMNLGIAANHPGSTQPYRGIVTTLRRLDAENSELFAFVAPNVSGRGGRAGLSPRTQAAGLGIEAWAPVHGIGPVAQPTVPSAGVTPPAGQEEPGAVTPQDETPTQAVDPQVVAAREQLEALTQEHAAAQQEYDRATQQAADAAQTAGDAAAHAAQAEADAVAARQAFEQAADPTREQRQAMERAEAEAQAARQAADDAAREAREAQAEARSWEQTLDERRQAIEDVQRALEAAGGTVTVPDQPAGPTAGDAADLEAAVTAANERAESAQGAVQAAQAAHAAAQEAFEANPDRATRTALEAAAETLSNAQQDADSAQRDLREAMEALSRVAEPSKPAPK